MKRNNALGAALVCALIGCENTPAGAPVAPGPAPAASVAFTSFQFTKIPPQQSFIPVTSPRPALDILTFQMNATQATGIIVKDLAFMISGSLQIGALTRYQLFYYPKGLNKPGVLVGTNNGSNWFPPGGSPSSFIRFTLAKPFPIVKDPFIAKFVLRADVVGPGTYFFYASAQTMLLNVNGVDEDVTWVGGDLPLRGDQSTVN